MMNSGGNNSVRTSDCKPPPLNQIHHAKINQRQDSNISSDSYSMMSSPGYSTKNMEAPLLQNVSKINKSKNIHHQNSTDSFIMSSVNKNINRNVTSGGGGLYSRRDSCMPQESFNCTSSPNPKLLDAPLLAHAAKMNSCEHGTINYPSSALANYHFLFPSRFFCWCCWCCRQATMLQAN
jgi:hypothetical protein